MSRVGVLFVGDHLVELQEVARVLTDGAISQSSDSTSLWTIDNRYYVAQIAISMITTSQVPSALPAHIDHQAIVAVFSVNTAGSLDQVQQLWSKIESLEGNYEVQLAIALCRESGDPPAWLEQADGWFAQQSTELVVVKQLQLQAEGSRLPAADGGAGGMDRVKEALHAHMWPGMQLKAGNRVDSTRGANHSSMENGNVLESTDESSAIDSALDGNGFTLDDDNVENEDDDELERVFAEVLGNFVK